ncbi:MAG: aminotransferase class I/II-fold pyridoxal phosphate-dependent enzyme, partial [Verrucomicrobiota bacterium]|nr:aminotransferase class I/II-fold pyridoxal phosphate-dependent enzyme [Verrucomicrobiota bacterium]
MGDGYLANIALGQARGSGAKAFDALFIDEYAHLSLRDAAKFVGCPVVTYRHCDGDDLAKRLAKRKTDRQILLLTDGVFGATGRITPSANLAKVLPRGSVVWVDDAHGAGVLGDRLRGTVEHVAPSGFKGRELIQST